jgi:hypothetical protein
VLESRRPIWCASVTLRKPWVSAYCDWFLLEIYPPLADRRIIEAWQRKRMLGG